MKLKNKRTGEIVETDYMFGVSVPTTKTFGCKSYDQIAAYSSLAELNAEWEDMPEENLSIDEIAEQCQEITKIESKAYAKGIEHGYHRCILEIEEVLKKFRGEEEKL